MRFVLAWLGVMALLLGACGRRRLESRSAVQAAIEAHLQRRSNILAANMTLQVEDVKFKGDRADAEVTYRSKETPELSVRIHYVLRMAGDRWEVESSSLTGGMGANPHSGARPHGGETTSGPPSGAHDPQASH